VSDFREIIAALGAQNPEALLLEPRSVYDPCVVGMTDEPDDHWPRAGGTLVAVYGAEKCVEAWCSEYEASAEAGLEWFGYNTSGAWMGENTPTFVWEQELLEEGEE
jgi:hypothetical protein